MNILITGSTGFLGKELVQFLSKQNNLNLFLLTTKKTSERIDNAEYIEFDFNKSSNYDFMRNIDIVIHLAALQHQKDIRNISDYIHINLNFTEKLLQQSILNSVNKFIYLSTAQVHGEETQKGMCVSEDSPIDPKTDYAKSKYMAENLIKENLSKQKISYTIIRSPLIYGKNAKGNLRMLEKLIFSKMPIPLGGIKNKRSNISIYNLISFINYSLHNNDVNNETFLISDNEDISTTELIKKIIYFSGNKNILFQLPFNLLELILSILNQTVIYKKLTNNFEINISKILSSTSWYPSHKVNKSLNKIYN